MVTGLASPPACVGPSNQSRGSIILTRSHPPSEIKAQIRVCDSNFSIVFVPIDGVFSPSLTGNNCEVFERGSDFMLLQPRAISPSVPRGIQYDWALRSSAESPLDVQFFSLDIRHRRLTTSHENFVAMHLQPLQNE
jgi:hypothetical protein